MSTAMSTAGPGSRAVAGVPLGELSDDECNALLAGQEEGVQTGNASGPIGRRLRIPAVASLTLLAAGIAFLGARHVPNNTQVTSEYFSVLSENSSDNSSNNSDGNSDLLSGGQKFTTCGATPLLKVHKVLHNNLGGHGPDEGAEGIFYEVGLYMKDHGLADVTGNVVIHATSPYHTSDKKKEKDYKPFNGLNGKFMSIGLKPGSDKSGTNLSFTVGAYNPETNESIILPFFSITFFDLDEGKNHKSSEYVLAKDFEHYYVEEDTEVNVTKMEDGVTRFGATKEGTGDDNPEESEALAPLMKNKAVTLSYLDRAHAEFTIGAEEGDSFRGFSFVLRPSLVCAKTKINGKEEDHGAPGIKPPLMDGITPATGMAVPNIQVVNLEDLLKASNGSLANISLHDLIFKIKDADDKSGSSTWHLGGLCALMIVAASLA
jgi:hypothetical protein